MLSLIRGALPDFFKQEQHCGSRLLYYKNSLTEMCLARQQLVQKVFGFPRQTIKLNSPGLHKVATPQP